MTTPITASQMTMNARQRGSLAILEAMTIHTADNAKPAENN
jgi:hypothetical protein